MNILFCTDGKRARRGGVGNYVQLLFAHFDRQNVVPYDWNLWTSYEIGPLSSHRFSINLYRKFKIVQTLATFPRLVKRGQIDLVHLNPSLVPRAIQRDMAFARRCLSSGVPYVVFFRGWDKMYEAQINNNPMLSNRLVDTFGRASKVIVLASEFKNQLVKWGFEEEKIIIETTAVDDNLLNALDIRGNIVRTHSATRFNILFLARIEKAKGIYEAIDTYRKLKLKYPFVSMTIAGDGAELPKVKTYVAGAGIEGITFLGWVDREDKRNAYLDAMLYLFPTFWGEGMPNSVLEAMAFGLPIITRTVGGLSDFFEDGKMGSITESRAPDDFASACEQFVQNPDLRKEIGEYNHNYAINRFLASRVAKRIENIYRDVLELDASNAG